MTQITEGEYKGNAMIIFRRSTEDKFPFQFGVRKARIILEHLEDIRKFVDRHPEA